MGCVTVKDLRELLAQLPDEMDIWWNKPARRGRFHLLHANYLHIATLAGDPILVFAMDHARGLPQLAGDNTDAARVAAIIPRIQGICEQRRAASKADAPAI